MCSAAVRIQAIAVPRICHLTMCVHVITPQPALIKRTRLFLITGSSRFILVVIRFM